MKLRLTFLLLSILCFSSTISAQQLDHTQGEIIVKTEKDGKLRHAIRDLAVINGTKTGLSIKKTVVKSLDMYLLEFDYAAINENEMLQKLARHSEILTAQFNHLIDYRLEPNDPEFEDQWQYINTGQSGGTPGADIDMELAWDITTGGVTANGDTIVVAALDDGIDLNHADFEDNRWRNWAEIPDNGIDDDNNGYIDDYEGWNSTNDTDDLSTGGGHGTPVAGIIGAKGNNGIGVTGVSWNVKVMIIKNNFQTAEAQVLAAYGYAYDQRVRYNNTNGDEGAFVVATNASWGIDGGQAADAPLWCEFYDTLGEAGILNCGATINGNQNVDTFGDLPTTCPSDYMIAVTNMNHNDNKVTQAGYGVEHIDLGAFGADTWTTALGGGYGGFGGTSGATPHVAGAIGLLYSAPCGTFASLAVNDPAAAALAARGYILGGVDPNESLDGITATGGRLNVRNSLDLLMANCGPCPPSTSLEATELTDVATSLTWQNNDAALSNNLRWRAVGDEEWTTLENVSSPTPLSGLTACTEYEFQVFASCEEENSGWSNSATFTTDGCCTAPEEVTFSNIGDNEFQVNFESILAAQGYNIRYRLVGTTEWTESLNAVNTSVTLSVDESCSDYEVQIATICATETTEYGASHLVMTTGCGACTGNDYCDRPNGDTTDEWLESVSINGTENVSGSNNGDAGFFGSPVTIDAGTGMTLVMAPGYTSTQYNETFNVWIDLDQDGTFEDNEKSYTSELGNTAVTADISIPVNAQNGITRMRIIMVYNEPLGDACNTDFFYGETEDYCINITGAGMELPCDDVTNITISDDTENGFTVSWTASDNAVSYSVEATPTAGGTATSLNTESTSVTFDNLEFCTDYNVVVVVNCDGQESEGASASGSTSCVMPCPEVENLNEDAVTINSITVSWDAPEDAETFNLKYAPVAGGTPTEINDISADNYTITGLEFCTEYTVEVQSACTSGELSTFVSKDMTTSCESSTTLPVEADALRVFPNPFSDRLQLEIALNTANELLRVEVINAAGQVINTQKFENLNAGTQLLPINVADNAAGIFFVKISTDSSSAVRRVVRL